MSTVLSRFDAETVLVARCRAFLVKAKLATTATQGTPNADLNDPLATALAELAVPASDPANVADADLAPLSPLRARFLDLAEIRTLETAYQQILLAPQAIQWEDFRKDQGANTQVVLAGYIKEKRARYQAQWSQQGTIAIGQTNQAIQCRLYNSPFYQGYGGIIPPLY